MFQRLAAVTVAAALQLAALGAPLFHAHLDDEHDDHHGAARVHAHIGGHGHAAGHHLRPGDGPALVEGGSSDPATAIQLFIAVESVPVAAPALQQAPFAMPALPESIASGPPAVAHSHDPPYLTSGPSRAPPSFLS